MTGTWALEDGFETHFWVGFETLAGWSWAIYLTVLSLGFLIYKMGIIIVPAYWDWCEH